MRLLLYLSLFPFYLFAQEATVINEVYVFENSSIHLNGNSNVTGYSCNLLDLSNNGKVPIKSLRNGTSIQLQNAKVHLRTKGFKCDNKAMTQDFLKSLKSEIYPTIEIEFLSFQLNTLVENQHKQSNVKADLLVSLAGVDKNFTILLDFIEFKMYEFTIKGSKQATMSDFEIVPPTALFGMVKVEDVIELEFDITFKLQY